MKTQAKQCVLIEDEFYALELLESFIKKAGNIEIAGKFRNPLPAYELLSKGNIDLLFFRCRSAANQWARILKSASG